MKTIISENEKKIYSFPRIHEAILFIFSQFMATLYDMCNLVNNYIHNSNFEELLFVRYSYLALSFVHRLERLFDSNKKNEVSAFFQNHGYDIDIYKAYIKISFKILLRDMLNNLINKTDTFVIIKENNDFKNSFNYKNVS